MPNYQEGKLYNIYNTINDIYIYIYIYISVAQLVNYVKEWRTIENV